MYNQPRTIGPDGKSRGVFYRNPIDCLWKTLKAEGVRGWYKGPIIPPCTADLMLTPDSTSRLNCSLPTDCSPYVSSRKYHAHTVDLSSHSIVTLTANNIIIGLYQATKHQNVESWTNIVDLKNFNAYYWTHSGNSAGYPWTTQDIEVYETLSFDLWLQASGFTILQYLNASHFTVRLPQLFSHHADTEVRPK